MTMWQRIFVLASLVALWSPEGLAQGAGSYQQLVRLNEEFVMLRQPTTVEGLPDYSASAVAAQKQALEGLGTRLQALDSAGWPISQRVDYQLVRASLAGMDFDHRVVRPWARDPGLYVDAVRRVPYATLPVPADRLAQFRQQLGAVPRFLTDARSQLSSASSEMAGMAIRQLEQSDGINQGEPRRAVPPEGVIGWYRDLVERLPAHHADLVGSARQALEAVEGFRTWLRDNQSRMTTPANVGLEHYDWYLRHVRLMPYTSVDVLRLGEREASRARVFLEIERNRNSGLPLIQPSTTEQEHSRRVRDAETHIREFIAKHRLLSIPEDTPPEFETDAFWIVRPGGKRHFWEELTYRDPRNNHIHASIPGHLFDGMIQRKQANPIRRSFRDGARSEGWAFYIEEMFVQAGLLDDLPRAKELFYIAQLKRAIRIPCEINMQTGVFTLQQAIDHMVREVPFMEPDLARYDLAIYLRRPSYGMNYLMGKVQMEQLLADRARQLGERFDLGRFHDEFLAAGPIPISLIHWEMTGSDEHVKSLWTSGAP
jgi:hypothetical protein